MRYSWWAQCLAVMYQDAIKSIPGVERNGISQLCITIVHRLHMKVALDKTAPRYIYVRTYVLAYTYTYKVIYTYIVIHTYMHLYICMYTVYVHIQSQAWQLLKHLSSKRD